MLKLSMNDRNAFSAGVVSSLLLQIYLELSSLLCLSKLQMIRAWHDHMSAVTGPRRLIAKIICTCVTSQREDRS